MLEISCRGYVTYLSWRVDDTNIITIQEGISKHADKYTEEQPEGVLHISFRLKIQKNKNIDIARLKPVPSATETCLKIEISLVASLDMIRCI